MKFKQHDYQNLAYLLNPFGFIQTRPGVFEHSLLRREFDFSAASVEGVISIIFSQGVAVGDEAARQNIREALGL